MTLSIKPININILFFIKFANFWYITCFVPNLISIWPRSPIFRSPFDVEIKTPNCVVLTENLCDMFPSLYDTYPIYIVKMI